MNTSNETNEANFRLYVSYSDGSSGADNDWSETLAEVAVVAKTLYSDPEVLGVAVYILDKQTGEYDNVRDIPLMKEAYQKAYAEARVSERV